jgi:hypothetical protein
MKILVLAIASAALIAGPAVAETTLEAVVAHGTLIDVGGMTYDVNYKPDGTFSAGEIAGTYKVVDGNKLCVTVPNMIDNQCSTYPDGKKSGDTFQVDSDNGSQTVKIK